MHVSRRPVRSHRAPPRQEDGAGLARRAARVAAAVTCVLLALFATAAPAAAQDDRVPLRLTVTVVPPSGIAAPRPTGRVSVAVDGRRLVSLVLVGGIAPLTSITPQLSVALRALGHRVTINYSGDSNYEASTGLSLTLPTRSLLTIVARPRDTAPPAIEIVAPAGGVRYARGDAVAAIYSCNDPDERSAVTTCDGPVASGDPLDTAATGTFSFTVKAEDALGNAASRTVTYEVGETAGPAGGEPGDSGAPVDTTGSGSESDDHGAPAAPPTAPPPPGAGAPGGPAAGAPGAGAPGAGAPGALGTQPPPGSAGAPPTPQGGFSSPGRGTGGQSRAAPNAGSSDDVAASRAVQQVLAPYDPRSDPAQTIAILVAAFTLLQLGASTGGLALAGGVGGVVRTAARRDSGVAGARERRHAADEKPKPRSGYQRLRIKFLGAGLQTVAIGDRSRTWSWPGTQALDTLSATLPARLARRSPLLARVTADGTYLRAILGSASLLGMAGGLALGAAAIRDTGGDALPPAAALTIAIAVLGVLDATAGLVAVLLFTSGVLVLGGVDSNADLRVMLSLAALWFVVPVLAGAARPLRRPPTRRLGESWDRAADFVIASLVGAWSVQQILQALPGLAGMQLPIAAHADTAAACVLAALAVRLAAETIASHLYPQRLDTAEAGRVPQPGKLQRLGASALRTTLFVFFGYIVAGTSWQLWAAAALFVAPQLLSVYKQHLPNFPWLFRTRPRGLLRIVLMLFVATAIGALLLHTMDEHAESFLADSFVILAVPGFFLALLPVFGREGDAPATGWGKRIAGIAILATGILLALGRLP
jgi:hypothetical protein